MDLALKVDALEAENERLRDEVEVLRELTGLTLEAPVCLRLTAAEAQVFGYLRRNEIATKPALMNLLYGLRPDSEAAAEKIVDVFICKMRKKVAPFGIAIETVWGQGHYLPPASKARVAELMEMQQ